MISYMSVMLAQWSKPVRANAGLAAEYAGKLGALGFASADVADALAVAIAQDGRPSLETALDWLCVNVPEEDLPAVFAAGVHHTWHLRITKTGRDLA